MTETRQRQERDKIAAFDPQLFMHQYDFALDMFYKDIAC